MDDLMRFLQMFAKSHPNWIKQVDSEASDRVDLWGKQAIRVVFPDGRVLWIQEAKVEESK